MSAVCLRIPPSALVFPGLYGFGAVARYAWGWDYYHIAFTKEVPRRLGVGIALRHALATRFDEPSQGQTRR